MANPTLNFLLKDYEQKKYKADLDFEKDKLKFYNSNPKLSELNTALGKLAIDISKAVLNNDTTLVDELKTNFNKLKLEKETLLKTLDIPNRCFRTFI